MPKRLALFFVYSESELSKITVVDITGFLWKEKVFRYKTGIFLSGAVQMKHKNECLKETNKFHKSFMILDYMTLKKIEEMAIITSTNAHIYIEMLENYLILSIEN